MTNLHLFDLDNFDTVWGSTPYNVRKRGYADIHTVLDRVSGLPRFLPASRQQVRWLDRKAGREESCSQSVYCIIPGVGQKGVRGRRSSSQRMSNRPNLSLHDSTRPGSFSCPLLLEPRSPARRSDFRSPSARPPELSDGVNGLYNHWFCVLVLRTLLATLGGRRTPRWKDTGWGYE